VSACMWGSLWLPPGAWYRLGALWIHSPLWQVQNGRMSLGNKNHPMEVQVPEAPRKGFWLPARG
jgi:hypothetical protein